MKANNISVAVSLAVAALAGGTASADARRFGVMVDAGVPDGALASFVYRPWSFVRLSGGAGTNLAAPTVRGSVSLIWGSLSVNVDGGHAFSGDMNPLARMIGGDATLDVAALRDVSYDYVNLHGGLEIGSDPVTFYIHAGMSRLSGAVREAGPTLSSEDRTVMFSQDPTVSVWAPSVRLGLIVYIAR